MPASRRRSENEASTQPDQPDQPAGNRAERRGHGKKKNGSSSSKDPFHVHENVAGARRRWEMRRNG